MLRLGGFFSVPGNHLAGWRHPDAIPTYDMDFQGYAHITQVAEAAKFDCIFFQDTVGVSGSRQLARGERARSKLSRTVKLEPTATLAALAMVTERIGLVATATTTYNEPYNIARRFMSIDHVSDGRAGWNLVTSQIEDESENFGFDQHMAHAERYDAPRNSTRSSPACGIRGRKAACCATRRPASTSTATRSISSTTSASTSRSRARSTSPARARAGR
jgi:alkanesulfonate monooxygenase SsuD/methylene tetrahydromethanopterin reductase-like flavin-dependent oxidoreductase (luciferase family)